MLKFPTTTQKDSLATSDPPPDTCPHQTSEGNIGSVAIDKALVLQRLRHLDDDSCPGPDRIYSTVLKKCASSLAEPLAMILKKSLATSTLPHTWKLASVSPIYKGKGKRSDPLNYRPISLTSITCKSMERIIAAALTKFFDEHNIISQYQFGFRPGRSTTEQLLLTYNDITSWFCDGECVDLILFDFAKAFDKVDHRLLLKKLKEIGVSGELLGWISDFLVGRMMSVCVSGCCSSYRDVKSGVPQGSVLGPLLFLVFVNHLVSSLSCRYMIFADYLEIYLCQATDRCPGLQTNIDILHSLATDWGLQFNSSKCVNLRFQQGMTTALDTGSYYTLDGFPIAYLPSHKDLGVTVDSKLKFHKHIELVAAKAGGTALNLLKSTVNRSPKFMLTILTTHLRPILEYASPVWNTGYKGNSILLENVQRRWTKQIEDLAELPYSARVETLDLFSVKGRLWRSDMITVWKIFHGLSTINPEQLFEMAPRAGTRGHCFKVFWRHSPFEPRKRFFFVRVTDDWNSLPPRVVEATSLDSFKHLLTVSCGQRLREFDE